MPFPASRMIWYLSEFMSVQMVLPVSVSYQPLVPKKMICMIPA